MVTINNSRDLKWWYIFLRMQDDLPLHNAELVKEVKRAIRAYTHRPDPIGRVFDESIDGYIALYPLPERIVSMDEAVEFFEDNERMTYRPTYYDCTGQLFTSWYRTNCPPPQKEESGHTRCIRRDGQYMILTEF